MWVGGLFAVRLTYLSPFLQVLAAYVLMMAGMVVGMLVPHALELVLPRSAAKSQTDAASVRAPRVREAQP